MSAIGAITAMGVPHAAVAGMAQPSLDPAAAGATAAAASPAPASQFIESKVPGHYLTGDPLTDRVVREFENNPLGHGSLERAADAVSASFTYDPTLGAAQRPVPGATLRVDPANSILGISAERARGMSTADVIAANQSLVADAMRLGPVDGLDRLHRAAAPGNALDAKLDQMRERQADLIRRAEAARGTPGELPLLVEANKVAVEVLLLQREQEKRDALRRLLFSLMCGIVPKALIQRMVQLGMGPIVEKVIADVARNGRTISKSMSAQLAQLRELGIAVHILPEHMTIDAEEQEDAKLAAQAHLLRDGRLVDARGRTVGVAAAQRGAARIQGGADLGGVVAGAASARSAAMGAGGVASSAVG